MAVRECKHHGVGTRLRTTSFEGDAMQRADIGIDVIGDTLAFQLARLDEGEIEMRMRREQAHEFGADVAARADDAGGLTHGLPT